MCTQKKLTKLQQLTPAQLAWIAGFLDGDGSIVAQIVRKDDYRLGYLVKVTTGFHQKTARIHHLNDLRDEIDLGKIRDRGDLMSDLNVYSVADNLLLLRAVLPYLRIKQAQAGLAITLLEQLPSSGTSKKAFMAVCELADQIAALNDSKKRTITSKVVALHFAEL